MVKISMKAVLEAEAFPIQILFLSSLRRISKLIGEEEHVMAECALFDCSYSQLNEELSVHTFEYCFLLVCEPFG